MRRRARAAEDACGARRSARDKKNAAGRDRNTALYLAELERLWLAPPISCSGGSAMSEMGVLESNGVPASERTNTSRKVEFGKRDNFIVMADTKLKFGERGKHCEVRVLSIVRRGIVWKASRQTLVGGQSRDRAVLFHD